MYTLHIANKTYSSWSLRPWALMKALNIPFVEQIHPFPAENEENYFYQFSPTGKVPCLHDEKNLVWDSLAIIEYLAEKHPNVWPNEIEARAWARSVSCEMHSGFNALRQSCSMHLAVNIELHQISSALQADLNRIETIWLEGMNKYNGKYLTGNKFTAVDAFYLPVAFRLQTYNLKLNQKAMEYAEMLLQLDFVQEWQKSARLEIWRDLGHDQEIFASGKLLKDYRIS